MTQRVYIIEAKRTPIGKFLGSLQSVSAVELATHVTKAICKEHEELMPYVDEVIVGNVLSAGQGQNIARQVAIKSGLSETVPAYTINMVCGSGMKAIAEAYTKIKYNEASIIIAGGTESMSQAPFVMDGRTRQGHRMGDMTMVDTMLRDGLTDAFEGYHMGMTAEHLAEKYDISRELQDSFANTSQAKALKAQQLGKYDNEIVPITVTERRKEFVVSEDEYINPASSLEKLASLRPAFKKDGSVTAGNASGLNDGASMLLLVSEDMVTKYGLEPLAEIMDYAQAGVAPHEMGIGPVPAIAKVLSRTELSLSNMSVVELNEAFAVQSLAVLHDLKTDHGVSQQWIDTTVNPLGGAIALGHPIGASGARIVTTLVHQLQEQVDAYGLASLCIGGGMGIALIIRSTKR